MSCQCFICNTNCTPSTRPQTTRASGSNIVDLLEEFLGFPLDYAPPEPQIACDRCVRRFNEYDDYIQAAKRAQSELTEIYLNRVCKKANQHHLSSMFKRRSESRSKSMTESTQDSCSSTGIFDETATDRHIVGKGENSLIKIPANGLKSSLKVKHRNIKTNNLIVCKCDEEFDSNVEYSNHTCEVKEVLWICDICNKTYQSKKSLRVHLKVHTGTSVSYTCAECGKEFSQQGHVKRHRLVHTGEKLYQCAICGKRFVHVASFRIHTAEHIGNARKKECSICGLKLLSNSHLERHMRVHSGDKPFACYVCGKTFAEKYNMKSHMKKSHPDDKITAKVDGSIIS